MRQLFRTAALSSCQLYRLSPALLQLRLQCAQLGLKWAPQAPSTGVDLFHHPQLERYLVPLAWLSYFSPAFISNTIHPLSIELRVVSDMRFDYLSR